MEEASPTSRPSKAARIGTRRGASAMLADQISETSRPFRPTIRGPTACEVCRNRKTKCDNLRPTCSYCSRVGATCSYLNDDEAAILHINGVPQLLQVVEHIKDLFQHQQVQQCHQQNLLPSPGAYEDIQQNYRPTCRHNYYKTTKSDERLPERDTNRLLQNIFPTNLRSVLKWRVFPQPCPHSIAMVDDDISYPQQSSLPSLELCELSRLEAKYIACVHAKNPILDLVTLHDLISQVAEHGLDWSARTCLVSMVCALGAISEEYTHAYTPDRISGSCLPHDEAFKYWDIAMKRLGFVIGQNNIESVQCLCLTGIWYMCNMQPLQGWKYFALASNTWYSMTNSRLAFMATDNEYGQEQSLTREQSLYFTCFKSECELTIELSLPKSILERMDYPYTFPFPPNIDRELVVGEDIHGERRTWYYYLAEIACRHLINRIIEATQLKILDPSAAGIERMLRDLEMFETQVNDWYLSLPPSIKFPHPFGTIQPLEDEINQLLRARYLGIRELCCRPFVELVINNDLSNMPSELLAKVGGIASQGLQYCMFRLQAVPPQYRHHGLWFQLPNSTTCALILLAADRARHELQPNAIEHIKMPQGWREQILTTHDLLAGYWKSRQGSVWAYFQVFQWALDGCITSL
ncbi:hypothetical protein VE01_04224 [Pseudogymnoascus verrucosus]|uniref:Zn(2)-C6 fungal-type domain-containing protein n=1 Tax=Pseudogymnoascus verrucosus TaxID=342668 RepID=A0A1B8GLS6_9PEZI|nr:uncharacterized protein VE01_04224 [Pseudogymnoascus verrucosus]OBT96756.2 hypothetical protein VE01_04224 [Pseudogymnoascus verrucosus]